MIGHTCAAGSAPPPFIEPQGRRRPALDDQLVQSTTFGGRVMGPAGSNGIFNAVAFWAESGDLRVAIVTTRSDYQAEANQVHGSAAGFLPAD